MSDTFGLILIILVLIYIMWYLWALFLTQLLLFITEGMPVITGVVSFMVFDVSVVNSIGICIITIPVSILLFTLYGSKLHNLTDWWDKKRVIIYNNLFKRERNDTCRSVKSNGDS